MTEEQKVMKVLEQFVDAGLISMDIHKVLKCIGETILGIGIGEQGIVTSREDVEKVLLSGMKNDDMVTYSIGYGRTEALLHTDSYATACAEVIVNSRRKDGGEVSESRFFQLLSMIKNQGEWKICALHASAPVVTEENIEAYPLKFAEKTLQSLKERIGEKTYQVEEQYRSAILSDTIAFYIINFTQNKYEKCECKTDLCIHAEPGQKYEESLVEEVPSYLTSEDGSLFYHCFSRENVLKAFDRGEREISQEYRMRIPEGGYMWAKTTVRMIIDRETGDKKGILYVRDIDKHKREELELVNKATYDGMTHVYNKQSFLELMKGWLDRSQCTGSGVFIMLDVDDFKVVNDTFGHPVGDLVLIRIAEILREVFGEGNHVGRLGGDEFCVLMQSRHSQEMIGQMLITFQEKLGRMEIPGMSGIVISSSQGVAYCETGGSFEEVYSNADKALYEAKKNGKARASFYNESMQE